MACRPCQCSGCGADDCGLRWAGNTICGLEYTIRGCGGYAQRCKQCLCKSCYTALDTCACDRVQTHQTYHAGEPPPPPLPSRREQPVPLRPPGLASHPVPATVESLAWEHVPAPQPVPARQAEQPPTVDTQADGWFIASSLVSPSDDTKKAWLGQKLTAEFDATHLPFWSKKKSKYLVIEVCHLMQKQHAVVGGGGTGGGWLNKCKKLMGLVEDGKWDEATGFAKELSMHPTMIMINKGGEEKKRRREW